MICPQCSHMLPDDSRFCQFCGEPIEKTDDQKQLEITPSKVETVPQKRKHKKTISIILAVALLLSVIANAAQLYYASVQEEKTNKLVDGLNQKISSKDDKIADLQAEYDDYKTLRNFIKNETPGYGSSQFYVSDGLIVLNQYFSKEITLTLHYNGSVTVSTDTSGNSATVSFNEDRWYGSTTTLTVYGRAKGITTVTFSTDVDTTTFKVMVVVI